MAHRECLWEREVVLGGGVVCRERRSVKQELMEGRARHKEAESSFQPS